MSVSDRIAAAIEKARASYRNDAEAIGWDDALAVIEAVASYNSNPTLGERAMMQDALNAWANAVLGSKQP